MTTSAALPAASTRLSPGPWLWGPRLDLGVFGGSALLALGLAVLGWFFGFDQGPFPEWAWLVFVLGVDVAHVYSTLFRTYLDRSELGRHPLRYSLVPMAVFAMGYALYARDSLWFWRCFAYVAVFHFVRQQAGWVAIYRAKGDVKDAVERWVDNFAIYAAMLYPLAYWHANLDQTRFVWFVPGDFVGSAVARVLLPWCELGWYVALGTFALRQLSLLTTRRVVQVGKLCVVVSTAVIWYVGIVATNNDFAFTVTNVIVHGVPYMALLWAYARARSTDSPRGFSAELVGKGLLAFALFLLCLACAEELLWDQLVFHERSWLFGASRFEPPPGLLGVIVPLLMVPQATHYVLDGLLWRGRDTRGLPAQRKALGFTEHLRGNS